MDLHQNRGSGESRSFPHLNFNQTAYRTRGRTPRSRSDRTTIPARSSRDRGTYDVESSPVDRQAIDEGSGPRSWPDRGPIAARSRPDRSPIVARSWPDRGGNHGYLEAKLKPNSHRFVAELKPQSMPTESPPSRHQTASTIASVGHDLRANFPL